MPRINRNNRHATSSDATIRRMVANKVVFATPNYSSEQKAPRGVLKKYSVRAGHMYNSLLYDYSEKRWFGLLMPEDNYAHSFLMKILPVPRDRVIWLEQWRMSMLMTHSWFDVLTSSLYDPKRDVRQVYNYLKQQSGSSV